MLPKRGMSQKTMLRIVYRSKMWVKSNFTISVIKQLNDFLKIYWLANHGTPSIVEEQHLNEIKAISHWNQPQKPAHKSL